MTVSEPSGYEAFCSNCEYETIVFNAYMPPRCPCCDPPFQRKPPRLELTPEAKARAAAS